MSATDTPLTQEMTANAVSSSALFIPLRAEYFNAFALGYKSFEYRQYDPRWNERTCAIGRAVTLSYGYGKQRRLQGRVTSFSICATPSQLPGWDECYGDRHFSAAVIGITLDGMND